jgi:WD40 repeat protein
MLLRFLCYVALFGAAPLSCSLSVAQVKPQIEIVLQTGHSQPISSIALSPDGKIALTAGVDQLIKLWDLTTASELRTFNGHLGYVTSVAISPDGKTALSGSGDKTVMLDGIDWRNPQHTWRPIAAG